MRAVPTPDELLAREDAGRNRAGLSALAAAIFLMFAFFVGQVLAGNAPSVTITSALQDAAGKGNPKKGLLTDWITYQHDKFALVGLQALLQILGVIAFAFVLIYLFEAAKGRRPEVPEWLRYLLYVGVAATIIGTLIYTIGDQLAYSDFLNGADHSTQAARDAHDSGANTIGQALFYIGTFVVIVSWVVISLNGMRVGLLTRFLGFLGILGGIITFFLNSLPIIEIFWLVVIGMTILQRVVAAPPAWKTGRAEPWPTQQQAREARERAAQEKQGTKSKPAAKAKAKAAKPAADSASPATSARKRKRRS
jgi:hypothetical protein